MRLNIGGWSPALFDRVNTSHCNSTVTSRAEADPKVGAVIGKALEASEGDAVIEVVVGKH